MFNQRQKFVLATIGWPLCALLVLTASGWMALDLYFVVSFVGFLFITELTAPGYVSLEWRRRLLIFHLVGLIGFVSLLIRRALLALPPNAIQQLLG